MTRKKFLWALFAAPLVKMRPAEPFCAHMPRSVARENEAALGLAKKPAPVGLRVVREYDLNRKAWTVRFEEFYAQEALRTLEHNLALVKLVNRHYYEPVKVWGETIHVRIPPPFRG
jgi:hypothetical protein